MKEKRSKEIRRSGLRKWIHNRRKRNQRNRIMKKPSFWKMFAKDLAVGLCVAMIVCYVGSTVAVSYYCGMKENSFHSNMDELSSYIRSSYYDVNTKYSENSEAKEIIWKDLLIYKLNLLSAIGNGETVLYNADTKEVLSETCDVVSIFLIVDNKTDSKRSYAYHCDADLMQEAIDDYNAYWETIDPDGDGMTAGYENVSFVIKDIFVEKNVCIPGQVQVVKYDKQGQPEIVKEYDYTPNNMEDYEHVVLEGDESRSVFGPFLWESIDEKKQALLKNYVEKEENTIWEYTNESEGKGSQWGCQYMANYDLEIDKDFTVKLVMVNEYNMFDEYGLWIVLSYVGVLMITLMIVGMTAYRSYMVRKNHYELDTYRRETTNAMAHDLKTPLMAISGYAENLRNNVHTEKKDYYADRIVEHVAYMNDMVANILELAKVENIGQASEIVLVNLEECTQKILKKYDILTTDKNLTVNVEGSCEIKGDKARMEQALENLISNAVKYAPSDTEINIRLQENVYEIRNQLDRELETSVEELWKPFVKGDNSRNEQWGTGIGLTIVKNIVDAHGFELVLQCEEQEFVAKILF